MAVGLISGADSEAGEERPSSGQLRGQVGKEGRERDDPRLLAQDTGWVAKY